MGKIFNIFLGKRNLIRIIDGIGKMDNIKGV